MLSRDEADKIRLVDIDDVIAFFENIEEDDKWSIKDLEQQLNSLPSDKEMYDQAYADGVNAVMEAVDEKEIAKRVWGRYKKESDAYYKPIIERNNQHETYTAFPTFGGWLDKEGNDTT